MSRPQTQYRKERTFLPGTLYQDSVLQVNQGWHTAASITPADELTTCCLNSAFRSRHFDKRHFGMPVILTEDDRKVSWSPHSFILPSSGLASAVTWPPALFPERIHAAVPCLKWDSLGEAKKLTERRSCVQATHPSVLSAYELLSRDKHSQHVYHPKTLCPWVLVWHDFWKVNSNIKRYHWITKCP